MEPWRTLVEAYELEDKLLRELVSAFPRELRSSPGPDGALSCHATLAHLAYWDGFTVDFFRSKLEPGSCPAQAPVDFEDRDRAALDQWSRLPFGEILARYLEASADLRDFLASFWDRLSDREKQEFRIPLRHHRDHRLALERSLAACEGRSRLDTMAHGA